jgi:hypothetical protein
MRGTSGAGVASGRRHRPRPCGHRHFVPLRQGRVKAMPWAAFVMTSTSTMVAQCQDPATVPGT